MGSLQLIASANANSGDRNSAFQFTNIPQTYTDLLLYLSLRTTDGSAETESKIFINGNESIAYSLMQAQGAGISVTVAQNTGLSHWKFITPGAGSANFEFSGTFCYMPNYRLSSVYRQMSISSNQTNTNSNNRNTNEVSAFTGQTSPVTQLDIFGVSGNIARYSSVYLYGIDSTP